MFIASSQSDRPAVCCFLRFLRLLLLRHLRLLVYFYSMAVGRHDYELDYCCAGSQSGHGHRPYSYPAGCCIHHPGCCCSPGCDCLLAIGSRNHRNRRNRQRDCLLDYHRNYSACILLGFVQSYDYSVVVVQIDGCLGYDCWILCCLLRSLQLKWLRYVRLIRVLVFLFCYFLQYTEKKNLSLCPPMVYECNTNESTSCERAIYLLLPDESIQIVILCGIIKSVCTKPNGREFDDSLKLHRIVWKRSYSSQRQVSVFYVQLWMMNSLARNIPWMHFRAIFYHIETVSKRDRSSCREQKITKISWWVRCDQNMV